MVTRREALAQLAAAGAAAALPVSGTLASASAPISAAARAAALAQADAALKEVALLLVRLRTTEDLRGDVARIGVLWKERQRLRRIALDGTASDAAAAPPISGTLAAGEGAAPGGAAAAMNAEEDEPDPIRAQLAGLRRRLEAMSDETR